MAFVVDDLALAAVIASIAGAGLQYKATSDAAKRQQQEALLAQQRQLGMQNEATQIASRRASDFDPTTRQAAQDQITQDLTNTLTKQVAQPQVTAQGVQVGSTIPQEQGGADYLAAKAKEQAKTTASLRTLAALMGRMGSADQLRRNEAVAFGDSAGQIGRIQSGADNIAGIDQFGIGQAGQASPGAMLAGAALQTAGAYGLANSGTRTVKQPDLTTGSFSRMDRGQAGWA